MEKRLYFLLGDVLSNSAVGILAGLATASLVGTGWPMLIGMLVGMVIGMLVSFLGPIVFSPLFGAHEIMLPTMLSSMLAGMLFGMAAAMQSLSMGTIVGIGALLGFGITVCVWISNARLHGAQQTEH